MVERGVCQGFRLMVVAIGVDRVYGALRSLSLRISRQGDGTGCVSNGGSLRELAVFRVNQTNNPNQQQLPCKLARSDLSTPVPATKRSQNVSKWRIWSRLTTLHAGSLKVPLNLSQEKRIWRLVIPIVLLAFVLGTTVGEVWHHHASFSSDACPICHVTHEAIEPPVASARATILVPSGPGPEPERYRFAARLAASQIAARAPPVS